MLDFIIKKAIEQKAFDRKAFFEIEREAAKKFNKSGFPKDTALLERYNQMAESGEIKTSPELKKLLVSAKTRSLSGIVAVTCLTKPFPCPGDCLYCPQADQMPKSYLRGEPAAERAYLFEFDPYRQMQARVNSLQKTGHPTDKIELIILGGTWSFYPQDYKEWFVANCFAAANGRSRIKQDDFKIKLLEEEKKINEDAENRIIGLTLETRPDWITQKEIKHMRKLGATRIELGVQSVYNDILKKNLRGHGAEETIEATRLLKDAGFKINYHIMLNMPGSDIERDEKMFDILFKDPGYRPDWLKIYPCVVLEDAPLYEVWKEGKFSPYSKEELKELLIRVKQKIPRYVRITRLIRDIPSGSIVAGATTPNLREQVQKEMSERGLQCNCIRCREAREVSGDGSLKLFRKDYEASEGKEVFLSYEDPERENLHALLRLRKPHRPFLASLKNVAIVRELHTYGAEVPVESTKADASQHKGLGKKLMKEAGKITKKELELSKLAVISGVGVRKYYKKLGYRLEGEYMVKDL